MYIGIDSRSPQPTLSHSLKIRLEYLSQNTSIIKVKILLKILSKRASVRALIARFILIS